MQNTTNIPETPTPTPKTINEALNILAYNEFFYQDPLKSHINPHAKDRDTIKSLVEANYAWTEKQGKLAVIILKRYLTKFQKFGLDIKDLLDNPKYSEPFRVIDFVKSIEKYIDEEEVPRIDIKFPYNKKLVSLIRCLKDKRLSGLGMTGYDGETKIWEFKQTDVTTYYLTLIAIRYDFKFVDQTLLDDYEEVKNEKIKFKNPNAKLIGGEIVLENISDSLQEWWDNNLKNKKQLLQIDVLKNLELSTNGFNFSADTELGKKIAHNKGHHLWIDSNEYKKEEVVAGLMELDCFPILMPVAGELHDVKDSDEHWEWLHTFERHGIDILKQCSFGFEYKQPTRREHSHDEYNETILNNNIPKDKFDEMFELHQMSKQFKYIDKTTKVIFVRNRIPRTLVRSKIKPRCALVTLGGGYFSSGTENLKRLLDNLPKKLYYCTEQPSNYDWDSNTVIKL